MNILSSIADFINRLLNWWFTVMPWEQAIHVRRGKNSKVKGPGFYWQIPFIDRVFIQTTRTRMKDGSMQTMTTADGIAITIKAAVGYSIGDIEKLYKTLYHPEITLLSMTQGYISEFVRDKNASDIRPSEIELYIKNKFESMSESGLKDIYIKITTFAIVRTYRLIQDGSSAYDDLNMNQLNPPKN